MSEILKGAVVYAAVLASWWAVALLIGAHR